MDDKKNEAGKKPEGTAAGTEGKVADTSAAEVAKLKGELAQEKARADKEAKEKEIYRSGLLTAKKLGKEAKKLSAEELQDPEKVEALIDAKLETKELEKKAETETAAEANEREKLREELAEAKRALEAKGNAPGFAGGSGQTETTETKPVGYWSDEQKAELRQIYKSRGFYSPEAIEKMVSDAEKLAMNRMAQTARGNTMVKTRQY